MTRFKFLLSLMGMGGAAKAAPPSSPEKRQIFVSGFTTVFRKDNYPSWNITLAEINQTGVISDRIFQCSCDRMDETKANLETYLSKYEELGGIGSYTPALLKAIDFILETGEQRGFTKVFEI